MSYCRALDFSKRRSAQALHAAEPVGLRVRAGKLSLRELSLALATIYEVVSINNLDYIIQQLQPIIQFIVQFISF